jgi:hypothetical protein
MGDTPFRLVFGLDPRMDFMEIDASGVVDPNALDGARSLKERRDRAREAKAREYYYDKFHRPAMFQEEDPTPELETSRPSKKLDVRQWNHARFSQK